MIRLAGWLVVLGITWIALVACGGDDGRDVSPIVSVPTRTLVPPTTTPTLLPAITTPTPTDLPAPSTLVSASVSVAVTDLIPESAQVLIDTIARDVLASDAAAGELRLLSVERFVWHDAAWGCAARRDDVQSASDPDPVPGYRIIFTIGTRAYIYHTDRGETFFRCMDQDWLALQGEALPLDPIAESMVEMAARDAAKRLDVAETDLNLVSVLAITWPDSSVGCPKPGAEYDDRDVAGYRIVFHAQNGTGESPPALIYHTSLQHVIRCEPGEEILPGFLRRALPEVSPTPETH